VNEPRRALPQIERILLVVGDRDAGKSTTLRSMFIDPRFGTKGIVPATSQRRIRLVTLSRERCLFMRLTSPHETQQNIEHFFNRLDTARR
jgi:ABC-type branched-subunit amino acid transport system ATPase component